MVVRRPHPGVDDPVQDAKKPTSATMNEPNSSDQTAQEPTTTAFSGYVACIGASAGGLDALEKFFTACPEDTGAAFVVIQHLSPDHKRTRGA